MKASKYYDSDFLTVQDVGTRALELHVQAVSEGVFKAQNGDENTKLVMHFADSAKPLVLNKTNAAKIISSLGDETDDWIGATVILTVGKIAVNGRQFAVIQVSGCRLPPGKKK